MPHSLDKMRAINTLIAHSLSPLVCLIYFCLYIVITKEVHPYAEESVLYLYNSSSSIVDATINAKDFSYYALPVHLLFRIGSLFGSDPLYCARLASIAFVIYAVYRLFKLALENIAIKPKNREIISAMGITGMLLVIFSTSSENLATFNIPYFYGLIALGQMVNSFAGSKDRYSREKVDLIRFEHILDSFLMMIMALSKPLIITFVMSSIVFNFLLLLNNKNRTGKMSRLGISKSLALTSCLTVSIVFIGLSIDNIISAASMQGTTNSYSDVIKFLICFVLTYFTIWMSRIIYSRVCYLPSKVSFNLPKLLHEIQEYCFVFSIPFTVYANIKLDRNVFEWDVYMDMFYDRKIIPIGLVFIYILFKFLYLSSTFVAKSSERLFGKIVHLPLLVVSLIIMTVPIIDKLTGSAGILNFSKYILNNSVSSYRDVLKNGFQCFLPSPSLWGAVSKTSFSSPTKECFIEEVRFSEIQSNLVAEFDDNYFINQSPNSIYFDHNKTKDLTTVECKLFDDSSGAVYYSGRKNIPKNQKRTTLVFEDINPLGGSINTLSCSIKRIPDSMKNRKFFQSIFMINESS